jgi:hypothetical protein
MHKLTLLAVASLMHCSEAAPPWRAGGRDAYSPGGRERGAPYGAPPHGAPPPPGRPGAPPPPPPRGAAPPPYR